MAYSALLAILGRGDVCAPKQYEHRGFAVGTALCTIPQTPGVRRGQIQILWGRWKHNSSGDALVGIMKDAVATDNRVQLLLLLRNRLQYDLVRLLLLPHSCPWLIKCDAALRRVLRTRMGYSRHGVLRSSSTAGND
jgi:hypothetical protein